MIESHPVIGTINNRWRQSSAVQPSVMGLAWLVNYKRRPDWDKIGRTWPRSFLWEKNWWNLLLFRWLVWPKDLKKTLKLIWTSPNHPLHSLLLGNGLNFSSFYDMTAFLNQAICRSSNYHMSEKLKFQYCSRWCHIEKKVFKICRLSLYSIFLLVASVP